ncbi:AAA family ATPase [Duganella violaceipulchra]|uniref:AAA family ATPase n=1 Tax=Duganella violaceipulchra TaxID=2849652 RepID=A0AA41HE49_9BURK|nr:AAA family ATPase [Duganella violaceicalia]MBV6322148.1 AAA family ATPase [Duganella violaceicalia]MCP2011295.1 wobble nucleotide-excising tRNase [Duganella violaceicalia]
MIESLSIAKTATYGSVPQTLAGLARFNFLFGTNGAGKTTITKVIANPGAHPNCLVAWKKGMPLEPLVYNRDFVERNFNAAPRLKGIFTLGEQDITNLDAIAAKKVELDVIVKSIEQLTNTLQGADQKSGKKGELATLESEIKDKCWAQKQKHEDAFKDAFTGLRGNSEKFKERTLAELASNKAELKTLDYLTEKAKTVFGETPTIEATVPLLGATGIAGHESNPILAKKVIGKEDVDIAELIQRLGNSDWVKQGQVFYGQSKPTCPFCQQKVLDSFEASLSSYFDETFAQDTAAIADLQSAYERDAETLRVKLKAVADANSRFMNADAFEAERSAIEALLATNTLLLANKGKEPSLPIQLQSLAEMLAAATKLVVDANAAVAAHNEIARNITKERASLTGQVWKYVLEVELKADLAAYTAKRAGLMAAITKLGSQIQEASASKVTKTKEIKELEKSATSIEPTIEGINGLLKSFGFRNFSLAKADDGPFYKLIRSDGSDAKESLSEGERSFLTFLYFFHLLKGSESESGMTADRVVVFDDPVSSLDSDVLFIVSSLIKSLFDPVRENKGGIKQIFVLTHNVYFHKEVTYTSERGDDSKVGERTYWTIRKGDGGATVQLHKSNPIKTSYDLLWAELRRPDKSTLTVQNTMRRILENYFKILGRIDFDKICDEFQGQQKAMCRSLFAWVNDGSHFSHDDAFYTFDEASIEVYMDIFKQVFTKTNQQAHYDMMMAGPH